METILLQVNGMSCGHCVKTIEGRVGELPGVHFVQAKLSEGTVTTQFDPAVTSLDAIKETIDDQGYEVT